MVSREEMSGTQAPGPRVSIGQMQVGNPKGTLAAQAGAASRPSSFRASALLSGGARTRTMAGVSSRRAFMKW